MYELKIIQKDGEVFEFTSSFSMSIYQAIDIFRCQGDVCYMGVRNVGYINDFADDYRLDIF